MIIWVASRLEPEQCALWERNPSHPDGEVWIASSTPTRVADTPRVRAAVAAGRIAIVDRPPRPKKFTEPVTDPVTDVTGEDASQVADDATEGES